MPPLSLLFGKVDFSGLFISLNGQHYDTLKAAQDAHAPISASCRELKRRTSSIGRKVTKLVHGEAEAEKAQQAAEALFGGGGALTDVPTIEITAADAEGKIIDVLTAGKIFSSKREARQMIQQGGLYIGENTVSNPEASFAPSMFDAEKSLLIRKGKKKYFRLIIQ
jgi:tyrosyl-tRNA synthetase